MSSEKRDSRLNSMGTPQTNATNVCALTRNRCQYPCRSSQHSLQQKHDGPGRDTSLALLITALQRQGSTRNRRSLLASSDACGKDLHVVCYAGRRKDELFSAVFALRRKQEACLHPSQLVYNSLFCKCTETREILASSPCVPQPWVCL